MNGKLSLNVDQLRVETFEPGVALPERGTVRGHIYSDPALGCDSRVDYTCHGYGTCGIYPCKQVP